MATREPARTPQPTVSIDDLEPSTRLAYFHSTSAGGDSAQLVAQQAQIVILTYGDEGFRDGLREAGYDGLVLQYLNASQVNGPGPYRDSEAECDAGYRPRRNGIARAIGAFCSDLHPHEDWFLHNGAGERLYSLIEGDGAWYHMNPDNEEWRAYASQAIASDIIGPSALGYDGAFLDNVELSLTKLREQVSNADGVVQEFAEDDEYQLAWQGYLRQVRARIGPDGQIWADFVADPNSGSIWSGYVAFLNGVMSPAFSTGYDPLATVAWENNLEQSASVLAAGKGLIAVGRGEQDDERLQQFSLASYLLIADGEQAYFRYLSVELKEMVNTIWMYPNYAIKLGAPLGPRQQNDAVWRRDFQCGYVEVNPAERQGTIVQTACTQESVP